MTYLMLIFLCNVCLPTRVDRQTFKLFKKVIGIEENLVNP